ncbi:MAG: phage portal protein [Planctomycetota bacterium]|jgi:capsid protein
MLDDLAKTIVDVMKPEAIDNSGKYGAFHGRSISSSRGGSDGSKTPNGISGSGSSITFSHTLLRRNGRVAYHQTPQAKSLVTRMADTVADIGLRWEPMPNAQTLGITPEEAEQLAREVKPRFDAWAKSKKQHRSGTMTWYQSQRLYQIFQHRDNDIFSRLFYTGDKDLLNPVQFEFIDPDQIRGDAFTSTSGFQSNHDGINRDSRGREKSYNVWLRDAKGQYKTETIQAKSATTGRIFMLHGFMPEYAGQGRGLSRLGNDVQEFQKITDLTLAEIQKAIIQSSIWGFVKPSKDEDAHNILQTLQSRGGAGPAGETFGSTPAGTDATDVGAVGLEPLSCYDIPEATIDRPGVFIANLPKGQSLEMVNNTAPTTGVDRFVDFFTSYLASARSMPIEVLLMKFSSNFSASRGALLLFWRVAQIWRDEMAADYLNPTVEMWLSEEIAAGRVAAPGWSDPRLRAAWLNSMWIGPPAPDIDPGRTAKARKDNLETGVTTTAIEARNFNGSDAENNKATLKREFEGQAVPAWSKGYSGDQEADDRLRATIAEILEEMKENDD